MEHFQNLLQRVELTWFQVFLSILILALTYFVNQFLMRFSLYLYRQQVLWLRKVRFWVPMLRIVIWSSGIFFTIKVLHPPAELILAMATSAGVAIGLAAQELVKYIFGAIIIWTDRVYQEGDRVSIGDTEGIVQSIGLRSTKIWAYDDTIIIVPNSKLLDAVVYNANSGEACEQILVDFFLPLDVDADKAAKLAELAAVSCDLVEPTKPIVLQVSDHFEKQTAMTRIRVKVYVRNVTYEKKLNSDISIKTKRLFREHGLYRFDGSTNANGEMKS